MRAPVRMIRVLCADTAGVGSVLAAKPAAARGAPMRRGSTQVSSMIARQGRTSDVVARKLTPTCAVMLSGTQVEF